MDVTALNVFEIIDPVQKMMDAGQTLANSMGTHIQLNP